MKIPICKDFEITFIRNTDSDALFREKTKKDYGTYDNATLPYGEKVVRDEFLVKLGVIEYEDFARKALINDLVQLWQKKQYTFNFKA